MFLRKGVFRRATRRLSRDERRRIVTQNGDARFETNGTTGGRSRLRSEGRGSPSSRGRRGWSAAPTILRTESRGTRIATDETLCSASHARTRMIVLPDRRSFALNVATASSSDATVPMFVRRRPSRTRATISARCCRSDSTTKSMTRTPAGRSSTGSDDRHVRAARSHLARRITSFGNARLGRCRVVTYLATG